jgi:NAD(P)H-dependent flavin oxidoreductase YrpB (nitropropane dioxygenase family)
MHTEICDQLAIELPIFAFSHCRDVVAAVSRAGGFGVLGALGFPPDQLELELNWLDEHVGDKPYGVDTVIPSKYEGKSLGQMDPEKLEAQLRAMIPQKHRDFVEQILADHGVPPLPDGEDAMRELHGWTEVTAKRQLEVALRHGKVTLIANALGTPPGDVIEEIHASGRLVVALSGAVKHAVKHKAAGVDIIVAAGYDGGGHSGEIGSVVLWPEVVDAVAPTPVLAAGGIGTGRQIAAALAMGAQGVWTGSLWLATHESDLLPVQIEGILKATSRDTVRSRSWTGKPARVLRSEWTDAWAAPDAPTPLDMPLQGMLTTSAMARTMRHPEKSRSIIYNPVGQIVGRLNTVSPVKDVIRQLVEEYLDAVERLQRLTPTC